MLWSTIATTTHREEHYPDQIPWCCTISRARCSFLDQAAWLRSPAQIRAAIYIASPSIIGHRTYKILFQNDTRLGVSTRIPYFQCVSLNDWAASCVECTQRTIRFESSLLHRQKSTLGNIRWSIGQDAHMKPGRMTGSRSVMGNKFEHDLITGRSHCRSQDTAGGCVSQIDWSWITLAWSSTPKYFVSTTSTTTRSPLAKCCRTWSPCKSALSVKMGLSFTYPAILSFHCALHRLFFKHHRHKTEAVFRWTISLLQGSVIERASGALVSQADQVAQDLELHASPPTLYIIITSRSEDCETPWTVDLGTKCVTT